MLAQRVQQARALPDAVDLAVLAVDDRSLEQHLRSRGRRSAQRSVRPARTPSAWRR